MTHSSQTNSPRRLTKQIALESPTDSHTNSTNRSGRENRASSIHSMGIIKKDDMLTQRQRLRKIGPFAVDSQTIPDSRTKYAGAWPPPYDSDSDPGQSQTNAKHAADAKAANSTNREEKICQRCTDCGAEIEEYTDEEIGIMIIILNTFIHREPALAAPFLPEILLIISKFASHVKFPWQYENATHLPGGSQSVAHQFIRCVLHQLAPNGIFTQMFLTQISGKCCLDLRLISTIVNFFLCQFQNVCVRNISRASLGH